MFNEFNDLLKCIEYTFSYLRANDKAVSADFYRLAKYLCKTADIYVNCGYMEPVKAYILTKRVKNIRDYYLKEYEDGGKGN